MKANFKNLVISGLLALAIPLATSCNEEQLNTNIESPEFVSVLEVSDDGTSVINSTALQNVFIETSDLTESELESLSKMKEEEKLARDVYYALYEKWDNTVFSRISNAENNHMNAIISLLKYYNSSDTIVSEVGIFYSAEVQSLYNELVAAGSVSIEEALKTGAMIEEMDIKDLRDAIGLTTNINIIMVFENLERGSRNHLRAFHNQLTSLGIVYTPVYISQEDYDQIVNSPIEKGKQYKGNGQGKKRNGGNGRHHG
ncbi:MAG: DUF2202 domain-containing protein [Bacteroidales bacterium]